MRYLNPKWLRSAELSGLYLFAFSMPTMESVKWAGFLIYFLSTVLRRYVSKSPSWRRPDGFEWFLLFMGLSALLSTLINWPLPNGFSGFKKTLTYLLLGWLIYTDKFSHREVQGLIYAITAGLMVGLVWSAYDFFSGRNPHLEFKSIPNLNRSAIYQLLSIFVMLGAVLDKRLYTIRTRAVFGCLFMISVLGLIYMGSRATLLGFLVGGLILAVSTIRKPKGWLGLFFGVVMIVAAVSAITMVLDNPRLNARINKFTHYYHDLRSGGGIKAAMTESEQVRYDYARIAWAQVNQKGRCLLGTGPDTYKYVDVQSLKFSKPLTILKKDSWTGPSHAHNEFLTRWVEIGLVGLGIHLLFLGFVAVKLFHSRRQGDYLSWHWVAGLGFLVTALVCGMFNTVLRSEMGWLSMIILGMAIQISKTPAGRVAE